ncbi:hypothetical protein D3C78_479730 [compost metagenome]
MQHARPFAAGAAYVEEALLIEQRGEALGCVLHCPRQDQVVVAGIDTAVAAQGLVDRCQGCRWHLWPWQVHGTHGVDQRFLDRVVAVQRRGGVDRQGGVGAHSLVQRAQHRLEQFSAQGLEQGLVADCQAFLAAGALGLLEQ